MLEGSALEGGVLEGCEEVVLGAAVADCVLVRTIEGGSVSTVASGAVERPSSGPPQPARSTANSASAELQ